jgi:hypothetical protein
VLGSSSMIRMWDMSVRSPLGTGASICTVRASRTSAAMDVGRGGRVGAENPGSRPATSFAGAGLALPGPEPARLACSSRSGLRLHRVASSEAGRAGCPPNLVPPGTGARPLPDRPPAGTGLGGAALESRHGWPRVRREASAGCEERPSGMPGPASAKLAPGSTRAETSQSLRVPRPPRPSRRPARIP